MKIQFEALLVILFHFIPLYSTLSVEENNDVQLETASEMIQKACELKKISALGVISPKRIKKASPTKVLESDIVIEDLGTKPRTAGPSVLPSGIHPPTK